MKSARLVECTEMRPEDGDEKEDARIASKMTIDFQDAEGRVKDGVTRVERTTKQLMAAYKIEIEEAKSGIKELKLIKEKEIHAFEKLKSDIKDCMDQRAQLEARIEQMELDQEMIKDSLKMAQGLKQKTWQDLIDAGGHIGAVQALKQSLVEVRQEIMQTKGKLSYIYVRRFCLCRSIDPVFQ